MKVQLVTPYRVSLLQRYGVTARGNVTSVYPPLRVLVQRKLRGSIDHSKTVARQDTGIAVVKVLHDLTSTNVMVSESATRQDYPAYKLHASVNGEAGSCSRLSWSSVKGGSGS
jgi:hypothetical protein